MNSLKYTRTVPPVQLAAPLTLTLDPILVEALNAYRHATHELHSTEEAHDDIDRSVLLKKHSQSEGLVAYALERLIRRTLGEPSQLDDFSYPDA